MKNTNLYVVCPIEDFQAKYDEYLAKGFKNKGGILYSLDGTLVIVVEEAPSMFSEEDLALPGVLSFDEDGIKQYLADNYDSWHEAKDDAVNDTTIQ